MKCPKCQNPQYEFIEKRRKSKTGKGHEYSKRSSNIAKCNKCGYEGYE